jgi:transcriptional regulator with XRE-family HTH domain
MIDDLAGKRTGERIQILRERKGLTRPVLAGLVGMSPSWLKGIEQGRRLPPRLPILVKLAEALAVGDVAVLAGTDMDLGEGVSVPVASFTRIPHDAVPAIREAIRAPLMQVPDPSPDVTALAARTADAWRLWHASREHRTDVGRIRPRLITDARTAARSSDPSVRRAANAVLTDVYALAQNDSDNERSALVGALYLHAATSSAQAGREGDAWRYWDQADSVARRLPEGFYHSWTMFGSANVALHGVSLSADLSKSAEAHGRAEQIDPEEIPSRERRGRLGVELARSYHQRRDYPAMLHWLEQAYQTSVDSVCYSPTARQMTAEAVDHGGRLISRRARTLAARLGLPL